MAATTLHSCLKPRGLLSLLFICGSFWSTVASAQLTWGPGGIGGSGTWDTTTSNWWNGTSNVPWTNGSSAIFAGTGGTITSTFPGPEVSDLTFNSPGYIIQDGWIDGSTSSLTITTNQAATISSVLNGFGIGSTLVKNGAATLTVSGTNFMDNVQINAGEYLVSGNSDLFFSDVTLADSPGVVLTLGQTSNTVSISTLLGNGIVRPNDQARTVEVTIWNTGTYRGVMQDNGAGKLALDVFGTGAVVTVAAANTYSGGTSVSSGVLSFAENGSALNSSAIRITRGGTLRLDNSVTALANRLADSTEVNLEGGRLEFIGHASTAVEEQLGTLKFSGAASVNAIQPGASASLLTFASIERVNSATIDITGNGRVKWSGLANNPSGIVGAYATAGNEWATVAGDGRVEALTVYASDLNAATAGDHVKIAGGGSTSLAASGTRATLNLQNSSGSDATLDLGAGHTLTLNAGGLLTSGTNGHRIQGGTLLAAGNELVVTNRNALTIASSIGESVAGTDFTKSGAGDLTLSGANTYSGKTVINDGRLLVSSDANLGAGSAIQFNGGSLMATQSFSSSKSITRGTSFVATIDTNGHDVSFSGTNTAGISKRGAGMLTLSNPSPGTVILTEGTLALTNPTSGAVTLDGGTLIASGTLSGLIRESASTIDIGGSNAATLTTGLLSGSGYFGALTVRFDLGMSASDLWKGSGFFSTFGFSSKEILFDFNDLGGVTTGTSYTLITAPSMGASASVFGIAPEAIAEGWNGTFSVVSNTVRVTFTSTPEPGSAMLLIVGGLLLGGRRPARRRAE